MNPAQNKRIGAPVPITADQYLISTKRNPAPEAQGQAEVTRPGVDHVRVCDMPWVAVLLASYLAGLAVFWRLCRAAPEMDEEAIDGLELDLYAAEDPGQAPYQEVRPGDHHEQDPRQDAGEAEAAEHALLQPERLP